MLTFFHGWRRKMGAAALVMACVLMAGWLRSQIAIDVFAITDDVAIGSADSSLMIQISRSNDENDSTSNAGFWQLSPYQSMEALAGKHFVWHWRCFGFGCGDYLNPTKHPSHFLLIAPYWAVVL